MDIKQFQYGINLQAEACQVIDRYALQVSEEQYLAFKQQFLSDQTAFYEAIKQQSGYRQFLLYFFVRLAVDAYEEYKLREIADSVYWDTFSDIAIWCRTCERNFGESGINEYGWLKEHVQLRLFKLGRLQFQPIALDSSIAAEDRVLPEGQLVLNVHIPEGEPLDEQRVEQSFEQARAFFRGIPPIFVCRSWLLDPKLTHILKPESNIIAFQKQFHIYECDDSIRQAEERIFNQLQDDASLYSEQTSLQRSAKAYLLAGHKLGCGSGIKM